jgi:hypothetical protein
MLLISSIMLTVLPTPAPPNRPTLPPLAKRTDQVDHLDPGFQQVDRWRQFVELRRELVDFTTLFGGNRPGFVDRPTENVHDATDRRIADRNRNAGAGVVDLHAAAQAIGRPHGNRADDAVTQLLLDFEHQVRLAHIRLFGLIELECVVDPGHCVTRELDVHHGADTLNNVSLTHRRIPNQ